MKKKISAVVLIVSMLIGCVSCAGSGTSEMNGNAQTALLDPVNAITNIENCTYHNLYKSSVYFSTVMPEVKEYAFSNDTLIQNFTAFPGEQVQKGDILATSDKTALEKQIKELEEKKEDFEEAHAEYVLDTEAALADPRKEVKWLKELLAGFDDYSENKDYYGAQYQIKEAALRKQEAAYAQQNEIYELDFAYYQQQLDNLNSKLADSDVYAGMNGTVVAVAVTDYGSYQAKEGDNVVAIGDMSQKLLKCDYIGPNTVKNAKDIYAVINGTRYELNYRAMSASEYNELAAEENAYSIFEFTQETPEVNMGDYAAIVVISDGRDQVLAVPNTAIHKNESGYFVYVIQEGESVSTQIKTGMTDGVYTEILEGLSGGESILLPDAPQYGEKKDTITSGSYSGLFDRSGYFFYPATEKIKNTNKYGDMYFGESKVSLYHHVNAGDVIATVRVEPDNIEIEKLRTRQNRLTARIADLEKKKNTYKLQEDIRKYQKNLTGMQKEIAELQKEIDERTADYSTTQILAQKSGIVVWIAQYEAEDLIEENSVFAEIADESTCYVVVNNEDQLLKFGTEVSIAYEDQEGTGQEAIGVVSNISSTGISKELKANVALISLAGEDVEKMIAAGSGFSGGISRKQYTVSADLDKMEQVLLVPREAVIRNSGNTYVNVIGKDGNVIPTAFIAGGYNNEYYWAISGLTEGMEVCWE